MGPCLLRHLQIVYFEDDHLCDTDIPTDQDSSKKLTEKTTNNYDVRSTKFARKKTTFVLKNPIGGSSLPFTFVLQKLHIYEDGQ